jgi:serine/threonine protein kinase
VTQQAGKRFPHVGATIRSDYQPVSYRVERVLGEGGTAVACLCTRSAPDGQSPVVLKVIAPRMVARSGDVAATLVRKEAVALGRLNERVPPSPFVVRLIEAGTAEVEHVHRRVALPWLALEYVHGGIQGTTLEQRVEHVIRETGCAFGIERAVRLIEHVAQGLTEVHAVDVVHRDLNPNNVLCCGTGTSELFKLSDFGIARPHGMNATFGAILVGTPGYIAPEQAAPGLTEVGFHSDLFSFAAVIYFVLTGEEYFDVNDVASVLAAARSEQRRRLVDAKHLVAELRERPDTCAAIDEIIRRATSFDPHQRPPSPSELANSITSQLGRGPASTRRRARQEIVSVMERAGPAVRLQEARWRVRHPPGDDRLIVSAAWNASGHCLAATTRGMSYWDGSSWADAPDAGLPQTTTIRFVRRLGASTWLTGGKGTTLAELSRDGTNLLLQGRDANVDLVDASGELGEVVVVIGQYEDEVRLYGVVAGHWLKGIPVKRATTLSSVAQIDSTRWLAVGRGRDGGAHAVIHTPLDVEVRRIELPPARALLRADGHPDRPQALAVGTDGLVLLVEGSDVQVHVIDGRPDLTACAMDIAGRPWVAGAGRLWTLDSHRGWVQAWGNESWNVPVMSIMAEPGFVMATTVDGAVVEFHTES